MNKVQVFKNENRKSTISFLLSYGHGAGLKPPEGSTHGLTVINTGKECYFVICDLSGRLTGYRFDTDGLSNETCASVVTEVVRMQLEEGGGKTMTVDSVSQIKNLNANLN